MELENQSRENQPVTTFTDVVGPHPTLDESANREGANASSFPRLCEEFESLSIPNRGIVLGLFASSLFWAALVLAAGVLRLLLH